MKRTDCRRIGTAVGVVGMWLAGVGGPEFQIDGEGVGGRGPGSPRQRYLVARWFYDDRLNRREPAHTETVRSTGVASV